MVNNTTTKETGPAKSSEKETQEEVLEAIENLQKTMDTMEQKYQSDRAALLAMLEEEGTEEPINDPLKGVMDQLTPKELEALKEEAGKHRQNVKSLMKDMILEGGSSFAQKLKKKFIKYGVVVGLSLAALYYYNKKEGASAKEPAPIENQKAEEVSDKQEVQTREEIIKIEKIDIKEKSFIRNQELFNSLSDNGKRIYLYNELSGIREPYIIADKPSASFIVFDQNNNLFGHYPALFGATPGEDPNTYPMNDPNRGINRKAKGATTPMGTYEFEVDSTSHAAIEIYMGKILRFLNTGGWSAAIHPIYPKEKEERTKALYDPDLSKHQLTGGCPNMDPEHFKKVVRLFKNGAGKVYVTPDDQNVVFKPQF